MRGYCESIARISVITAKQRYRAWKKSEYHTKVNRFASIFCGFVLVFSSTFGSLFTSRFLLPQTSWGFLPKFEKQVPSTAEDPEAITTAVQLGNEKSDTNQNDSGNETTTASNSFQVTAEMERKLVRKLDTRLVLLVMGLCM
jgi:hypothetical protein